MPIPPASIAQDTLANRWIRRAGLAGCLLAVALGWSAPAAATDPSTLPAFGLFGSLEFRIDDLSAIRQWTALLDRHAAEASLLTACEADTAACPNPRVIAWRAHLRTLNGRHSLGQLQEINRFVNRIVPYREDPVSFGAPDYWATPIEFLRSGGDCEDFAIMKYLSLLELGFPDERMRIVVVADTVRNLPHAVLAVDVDDRTYILDSLFDTVISHERLRQYLPQYSVNRTHRWTHLVTPELIDRFHQQAAR